MPTLLIINPNRTEAVTATLARHARAIVDERQRAGQPHWTIAATTARFGASYISSEASFAVASHASIDAYAAWCAGAGATPDVVLIGCFGDPGLMALRETTQCSVIGLAEASMRVAARHGRFAILTGGRRWQPMLTRLARAEQLDAGLAVIHTVTATGGQMAADPERAQQWLAQACRELTNTHCLDAIVLGGAGLAGIASRLQPAVDVPVIDSVVAGITMALDEGDAVATSNRRSVAGGGSVSADPAAVWDGLSRELADWLRDKP